MELLSALPPELASFRRNIKNTIRPFIKITANQDLNLSLWQSKFGGFPYLPIDKSFPKDSQGKDMFFLAQINFAEFSNLEDFPSKGLIQFFISNSGDLYGLDFDDMTNQDGFKVIYYPELTNELDQLTTDFDFLLRYDYPPLERESSLGFEEKFQPISVEDYQFKEKVFGQQEIDDKELKYRLYDLYQDKFPSEGHKIGGYPYFTQSDPRENQQYREENYRLLFQMDSDYNAKIMWGDAGVANFFIRENDLLNADFSNILYSWDCS